MGFWGRSVKIRFWYYVYQIHMYDLRCLNPNWHELWKQEKCSSLAPPRCIFHKTQWAWQDVKLTRLMSIFTSKKVWKFSIINQLTKFDPKKGQADKTISLMPVRINLVTFRASFMYNRNHAMFKTYPNLSNKNPISMQNLPQILLDQEIPHLPVPGVCIFRNSSQNNRNNSSLRFQKKMSRGTNSIFIYKNTCNLLSKYLQCMTYRCGV